MLFISKTRENFENFEATIKCTFLKISKFGMVYEEVSFSLYEYINEVLRCQFVHRKISTLTFGTNHVYLIPI